MKSQTIIIAMILTSIFFGACAGLAEMSRMYMVEETHDEFEDTWVFQQKYNKNGGMSLDPDFLNIMMQKSPNGEKIYHLVVYKEGGQVWLYADKPLQIKADDEILEFSFLDTRSHVLAATNVQKWGYYLADSESIEKILNAERVIAKIYTTDGFYNAEYDQILVNRMRSFMAKYSN